MENSNHEHHEHAEHVRRVHVEKRRKSLRDKPWVVSTFVLALLVVLLILANVFNITGKSISANKASEKLLDFAVSQGLDAEVASVTSDGSFYKKTLLLLISLTILYMFPYNSLF